MNETTLLAKFKKWRLSHRESLIDLTLLAASLVITGKAISRVEWPLSAYLLPLIVGILLATGTETRKGWHRLRASLPKIAGVAAFTFLLHRYYHHLAWQSNFVTAIWILLLAFKALWPALRERLLAVDPNGTGILRLDALLGESVLLVVSGLAAKRFWQLQLPDAGICAGFLLGWLVLRFLQKAQYLRSTSHDLKALALALAIFGGVSIALSFLLEAETTRDSVAVGTLSAAVLLAYRYALLRVQAGVDGVVENLRWIVLLATGSYLLHPFVTPALHGAGDAHWYAMMLADMVEQVRSGVFPVWTGQTEYQFNGAIYPLRVAPLFHYSGALLDLVTLQTLDPIALQNLLIVLTGLAALGSAYVSLRIMLRSNPWLAAGFATLYLGCPGILGIAYVSDLYMSWTTLPWVPLVWLGMILSFSGRTSRALLLLAVSLGMCWWGHSPIALWSTLVAASAVVVRFVFSKTRIEMLPAALASGILFCCIALYPIVSVLFYPPEPGIDASGFQKAAAKTVVQFLRESFPQVLHPLSETGRALSDLQFGYAVWLAFFVGFLACIRARSAAAWVLIGWGAVLATLLNATKPFDMWLWERVPDFVRDTTSNWVMNRLYLIGGACILFGCAAACAQLQRRSKINLRIVTLLTLAGCFWTLKEAGKFMQGSEISRRPIESGRMTVQTENIVITRFAYLVFPSTPDAFTHGATDPRLEHRLLGRDGTSELVSNGGVALEKSTETSSQTFVQTPGNANSLDAAPQLLLKPGSRYLHVYAFEGDSAPAGVLVYEGSSFRRVYQLPEYGGKVSFGAGPERRKWIPLHTSLPEEETVTLRFLSQDSGAPGPAALPLAKLSLREYAPAELPIQVSSWAPYRLEVTSPAESWLETPRMYQQFYQAEVNGAAAEVRRSPRGHVMVAVPAGKSRVEVAFDPPSGLGAAFWLSFLTMCTASVYGAVRIIRSRTFFSSAV